MVKKYPFSTKAAKAMIAATIAFTPVATTAGVFGADKVEAAAWHFNTKATLANYANDIYDNASFQSEILEVQDALESITNTGWKTILAPIIEPGVIGDQEKEAELNNAITLLRLQLGLTLGSVTEADINTVIMTTKDNFGFGNTSQAQVDAAYLTYLENVEVKLKSLTTNPTNLSFATVLTALKEADGDARIKDKIASTFVLTPTTAEAVKNNLEATITTGAEPNTTPQNIERALAGAYVGWSTVYDQAPPSSGGGGGTPPPPTGEVTGPGPDNEDGPVVVDPVVVEGTTEIVVTIPETLQTQIVNATQPETTEVIIEVPASEDGKPVVLDIPVSLAAALKTAAPNADIVIQSGDVSYVIPVSKINLTALGASLGGSLEGVSLRINLEKLPTQRVNNLQGLIRSQVGAPTSAASSETSAAAVSNVNIVAPAIEVTVELVKNDMVVQELKSFGSVYVNQEFVLDTQVDTNRTTGVSVEADGSFKALPTTFKSEDGKQIAVVKTLANAGDVYTVLESSVTFPDVDGGKNWAEKYIESLSSKFIISGTTAGTYKPDQDMTRSQFAFLLSRALGLPGTTAYDGRFSDVEGDEWFNANGEFMAAVQYGVIAGKTDGTFGADEKVTRAEAAAMIGRAMELGFIEFDKGQLDTSKTLAGFKDAREIGASTRAEVLKVVQAGIMSGASNGEFNPNDYTKRDQMARILAEFLMKAELMQNIK